MQIRVGQRKNSLMQVQVTLREKNNSIVESTELLNFLGLESCCKVFETHSFLMGCL